LVGALSVAGAIFLILELSEPYRGLMRIFRRTPTQRDGPNRSIARVLRYWRMMGAGRGQGHRRSARDSCGPRLGRGNVDHVAHLPPFPWPALTSSSPRLGVPKFMAHAYLCWDRFVGKGVIQDERHPGLLCADSGRSPDDDWSAQIDPHRPRGPAPASFRVGQEVAIQICPSSRRCAPSSGVPR